METAETIEELFKEIDKKNEEIDRIRRKIRKFSKIEIKYKSMMYECTADGFSILKNAPIIGDVLLGRFSKKEEAVKFLIDMEEECMNLRYRILGESEGNKNDTARKT